MKVAYLGPPGTHSELAFREFAIQQALSHSRGMPCFTVSEVFRLLVEGKIDAGFVPIENMIQGPVTETLDLLLAHHGKVLIVDSYLGTIRNAIGVLPASLCDGAAWPRPIDAVYSHEQPLRQCAKHIAGRFPQAESVPTSSTAQAIHLVKEAKNPSVAVIAAAPSLLAEGFVVLAEDVSDVPGNKTRFVLVKRGNPAENLPPREEFTRRSSAKNESLSFVTSLVVDPGRDRKGLLFEILQVISIEHRVNLVTIHSRPDTRGGVVFYLDLEGHPSEKTIQNCLATLRKFCVDNTGRTTEIHILGAYPRSAFYQLPFARIGIIGIDGVMGTWFRKFFANAGLRVIGTDAGGPLTLKELAEQSDVLLVSVPMSTAVEVASELTPHLRAGQLVVENCSIKDCVLPYLSTHAPLGVEVLGIHSMFAGDIDSIEGQNVVVTYTQRSGEKAQAFEDLLYKFGAVLTPASTEEHDHAGAYI